jgi:hypothetical protein
MNELIFVSFMGLHVKQMLLALHAPSSELFKDGLVTVN